MFSKDFSLCALYDRYAPLLTEKQAQAFFLYYSEDFSLSEIAEHTHTSRQAVQSLISKTESELRRFEESLHLCQKEKTVSRLADELLPTLQGTQADTLTKILLTVKE